MLWFLQEIIDLSSSDEAEEDPMMIEDEEEEEEEEDADDDVLATVKNCKSSPVPSPDVSFPTSYYRVSLSK